jgi:hypothetical protein
LFGYFYIVSPYFIFKNEDRKAKAAIEAAVDSIDLYRQQVKEYRKVHKQVNTELYRIEEEIHSFPVELAQSLSIIGSGTANTNDFAQIQQSNTSSNPLGIPDSIADYSDRVGWYVNYRFDEILEDINQKIIIPSARLDRSHKTDKKSEVRRLADEAVVKIKNHIGSIDPDFWRTYETGKVRESRLLEAVVEESLNPVFREIDTLVIKSAGLEQELLRKIAEDSLALKTYASNIALIEKRIDSVESPIGKIPLNLVDFVQLFPVLIIVLAVMLTNYASKSVRSIGNLQMEFKKMDNEESIASMKMISDCWFLPPFRSIFPPFILITSIVLIIAIYLFSVIGLFNQPDLFVSLTGTAETIKKYIFFAGYGIGFLILIGCFLYIDKQIKTVYSKVK